MANSAGGRLPIGRASGLLLDGALRVVAGFENGDQFGDQPPLIFQSGAIANATTAPTQKGSFVAPCDLTIVGCVYSAVAASLSSDTKLNVGARSDDDKFIASYIPVGGNTGGTTATGVVANTGYNVDLTATDGSIVELTIDKGEFVEFGLDAVAATATGTVAMALICVPRNT